MDDDDERTVNIGKHTNAGRGLRVIVIAGEAKPTTHYLPPTGQISIGRFTGSKLVIEHSTLSRMHAIVRVSSEEMTIEDLGSENGTFVRETRIKPGAQVPFSAGDVVRVGEVILIFRL